MTGGGSVSIGVDGGTTSRHESTKGNSLSQIETIWCWLLRTIQLLVLCYVKDGDGVTIFYKAKEKMSNFFFFWFYLDLAPDVQKSNSFYSTHTNATEDGGLMHSSVSVGGHTTEGHDGGEDDEEGVKGKMIVNVSSPV